MPSSPADRPTGWRIYGQTVTSGQVELWVSMTPPSLLTAIGRKAPGRPADARVGAAKLCLLYEYINRLNPQQREEVSASIVKATGIRRQLDRTLRNKFTLGLAILTRIANPLSHVQAIIKALVAAILREHSQHLIGKHSALDPTQTPAWHRFTSNLWAGITADIIVIAGSLALATVVTELTDGYTETDVMLSVASEVLSDIGESFLESLDSAVYAWEPF